MDLATELLDVMADAGYSPTGPDHDPVEWLRIRMRVHRQRLVVMPPPSPEPAIENAAVSP